MADLRRGIISYGAYLPSFRLSRASIAGALGTPPGKGTRASASFDEDTTSMGVEAARTALSAAPAGTTVGGLYFATTTPAYLDKTNATAIHAAVGLDPSAIAVDMVGAVRSSIGAVRAAVAADAPTLTVLSDVRVGLPGSVDERDGGDGAAAFVLGPDGDGHPLVAELVASSSATGEFVDRWRVPGEPNTRVWEERFGEQAYVPLAEQAITDLLKQAGVTPDALDHVIVTGSHARAVRRVRALLGASSPEAVADDLVTTIGNPGAAQPGIVLADVLDRATPDQLVALVNLSDGADAMLWRTTAALTDHQERAGTTVRQLAASALGEVEYPTYLTWRGLLRREPPRRPDPFRPESPAAFREGGWKYAFTGSRCTACDTRHLPGQRVCVSCSAVDQMTAEPMAGVRGRVATYTIDRLAYSLNPPVVVAVVDFEGGGRYQCEMTDVDPDTVAIGDEVEMTFRRLYTAGGVHNYFWKARPAPAPTTA